MPDQRITFRFVGSRSDWTEFSSFMENFPGLSAETWMELLNSVDQGGGEYVSFPQSLLKLGEAAIREYFKRKPRCIVLTLKNGESLTVDKPTKEEVTRAFDSFDRMAGIATLEILPEPPPPVSEPGVIEGFARKSDGPIVKGN